MSDADPILLVGADPLTAATFRRAVDGVQHAELLLASRIGEAIEIARETPPTLVVARHIAGVSNVFDICRKIKADATLSTRVFAIATTPSNMEWDRAFGAGAEGVLPWPLTGADLQAMLASARRVRQLHQEVADATAPDDPHTPATWHVTQDVWLRALTALRDEAQPAAAVRAEQIVEFAHHLAAQFGIPAMWLRDLDRAGRFSEIGNVFCGRKLRDSGGLGWHNAARALGTYALLARIDGLTGAAELTAMVTENWNGSGFPRGIAHADIPLRARILRVARDYVALVESGVADPGDEIISGSGVLYDPLVIEHFRTLAQLAHQAAHIDDSEVVPVSVLRSGMTLANDVFTHTGLLLLHEGTVLTPQTIQQILRVHHIEPIRPGIAIRRATAA